MNHIQNQIDFRKDVRIVVPFTTLMIFIFAFPFFYSTTVFYYDWPNHIWLVNYFLNFTIENGFMPNFLYQTGMTGDALPLYYGFVFYGISSLVALFFGAKNAIILVCLTIIVVSIFLWFYFLRFAGCSKLLAMVVAVAVSITIYQQTNLFSRNALTEFFAFQCLVSAVASLGLFFLNKTFLYKIFYIIAFSSFVIMCGGTHPPTILLLGFTLVLFLPALVLILRTPDFQLKLETHFYIFALVVVLTSIVILIFNYPYLKTIGTLKIENLPLDFIPSCEHSSSIYYCEFDKLFYRLMPIPIDPRVILQKFSDISTPNLTAPVASPLLILYAVISSWRRHKKFQFILITLNICIVFFYLTACSVPEIGPKLIPEFIKKIQFAYRLVNFCNFSLIFGIFLLILITKSNGEKSHIANLFLGFSISIIVLSSLCKSHDVILQGQNYHPYTSDMISIMLAKPYQLPSTFYGRGYYTTNILNPTPEKLEINISQNVAYIKPNVDHLDNYNTVQISCNTPKGCSFKTNIYSSIWLSLTLDGNPIKTYTQDDKIAFYVNEEGRHTIWMLDNVPPIFIIFRNIMIFPLTMVLFVTIFFATAQLFLKKQSSELPSN